MHLHQNDLVGLFYYTLLIVPQCCLGLVVPPRITALSMRSSPEANIFFSLHATKDDDITTATSSFTSTSSSLYQPLPTNKPWTFGILTTGFPPQQILVPVVKFVTFQVWRLMMNELVTHDEQGRFIRESYQATEENESKNVPLVLLPAASEPPRYGVIVSSLLYHYCKSQTYQLQC